MLLALTLNLNEVVGSLKIIAVIAAAGVGGALLGVGLIRIFNSIADRAGWRRSDAP